MHGKKISFVWIIFLVIIIGIGSIFAATTAKNEFGKELGFSNANDVIVPDGVLISQSDAGTGNTGVTINGGSMTYNHNGKSRDYKNVKSGGKFIFKDKKISSAEFETTDDSTYAFANHEVKVPKGSKVIFKDNKVSILLPKGSTIEKPVRIAKADESKETDAKIEYKFSESPDSVKIKDGKEYTLTKSGSGFSVSYDGKVDAFLAEGEYSINGLKVGEFDSTNRKNYLFFDGAKHDLKEGSYISIGDKIVIGAAKGFESPSVQFLKGNGILDIKDKEFIVMQSNGGAITVEGRNSEGKIPRVTSQGDYTIFAGDKVIRFKEEYKTKYGGPLLKANKNNLGVDFGSAGTTPMQVVTLDSNGARTGNWDVVVDNNRGIRSGLHDKLEEDYVRIGGGQTTSIRSSFYSLTKDEQDKLKTMTPEKQKSLIGKSVEEVKSEIQKNPIPIKVDPKTPTDNKDNKNPNDNKPKAGDKLKDDVKQKIENSLKKTGMISKTGKLGESTAENIKVDSTTKVAYPFTGTFKCSNCDGKKTFSGKIAITPEGELYKFDRDCKTESCSINAPKKWVKMGTINIK